MSGQQQSVGDLSEQPLAHLFLWAYQTAFSGVLVLAREKIKKSIVFERGKLVAARSNVPGEILGAILMEEGKITPQALAQSVEKLKGQPALRQGEVLIEMGLIDHALLNEALQKQILRRVNEVFSWSHGRYALVPKIPEGTARIDLSRSLIEICYRGLMERYRSQPELKEPADTATPNFVGGQNWNVEHLRLVGRELGVWRAIDGVSTVGRIIERSKLDAKTVRSMLLALRDMALVRLSVSDNVVVQGNSPERRVAIRSVSGTPGGEKAEANGTLQEVESLLDEFRTKNHFEILKVPRNAGVMEVKNAYFALAKKYHPDRVGVSPDALERKSVEDLFAKITEAHSVLTNESARKEYEATLGLQESGELGGADAGRILESEVSFQKGSVLVRKGDFSGAIEFLQQAIGLYDAEPEYHLLLGWASYRNASKSRDAAGMKMGKGMIEKALLANEKLAQGHFYQGLIAKSEGEIERAKRCFEKTVALDPRHNEANSELRVLNLRRSKDASAGGLKGLFKKKAE